MASVAEVKPKVDEADVLEFFLGVNFRNGEGTHVEWTDINLRTKEVRVYSKRERFREKKIPSIGTAVVVGTAKKETSAPITGEHSLLPTGIATRQTRFRSQVASSRS